LRVKEVRFEKLFSLEGYNNERIGFTVELSEAEDENKVIAELFFKVCRIEECLNAYRRLLRKKSQLEGEYDYVKQELERDREALKKLEIEAESAAGEVWMAKSLELSKLKREIEGEEKRLEEVEVELGEVNRALDELKSRMKSGEFELKGVEEVG
jgi:chromosome segregation ATPase